MEVLLSVASGTDGNGQRSTTRRHAITRDLTRISIVAAGTLWWYVLAAHSMMKSSFLGTSERITSVVATCTVLSQCLVYAVLWRIAHAQNLREVQAWICVCILLCVPADSCIILAKPLGNAWSVAIFYEVTIFFGVYIIHYLKVADACGAPSQRQGQKPRIGVLAAMAAYRPGSELSAVLLAFAFAKDFVGFTCAAAGVHALVFERSTGQSHFLKLLGGYTVSVFAAALDMTFTLIFSGIDLSSQTGLLVCRSVLDVVVMVSAVAMDQLQQCEGSMADKLVCMALFGVGTVNFGGRLRNLLRGAELDAVLRLDAVTERAGREQALL